jgi:hypothetical protein
MARLSGTPGPSSDQTKCAPKERVIANSPPAALLGHSPIRPLAPRCPGQEAVTPPKGADDGSIAAGLQPDTNATPSAEGESPAPPSPPSPLCLSQGSRPRPLSSTHRRSACSFDGALVRRAHPLSTEPRAAERARIWRFVTPNDARLPHRHDRWSHGGTGPRRHERHSKALTMNHLPLPLRRHPCACHRGPGLAPSVRRRARQPDAFGGAPKTLFRPNHIAPEKTASSPFRPTNARPGARSTRPCPLTAHWERPCTPSPKHAIVSYG